MFIHDTENYTPVLYSEGLASAPYRHSIRNENVLRNYNPPAYLGTDNAGNTLATWNRVRPSTWPIGRARYIQAHSMVVDYKITVAASSQVRIYTVNPDGRFINRSKPFRTNLMQNWKLMPDVGVGDLGNPTHIDYDQSANSNGFEWVMTDPTRPWLEVESTSVPMIIHTGLQSAERHVRVTSRPWRHRTFQVGGTGEAYNAGDNAASLYRRWDGNIGEVATQTDSMVYIVVDAGSVNIQLTYTLDISQQVTHGSSIYELAVPSHTGIPQYDGSDQGHFASLGATHEEAVYSNVQKSVQAAVKVMSPSDASALAVHAASTLTQQTRKNAVGSSLPVAQVNPTSAKSLDEPHAIDEHHTANQSLGKAGAKASGLAGLISKASSVASTVSKGIQIAENVASEAAPVLEFLSSFML